VKGTRVLTTGSAPAPLPRSLEHEQAQLFESKRSELKKHHLQTVISTDLERQQFLQDRDARERRIQERLTQRAKQTEDMRQQHIKKTTDTYGKVMESFAKNQEQRQEHLHENIRKREEKLAKARELIEGRHEQFRETMREKANKTAQLIERAQDIREGDRGKVLDTIKTKQELLARVDENRQKRKEQEALEMQSRKKDNTGNLAQHRAKQDQLHEELCDSLRHNITRVHDWEEAREASWHKRREDQLKRSGDKAEKLARARERVDEALNEKARDAERRIREAEEAGERAMQARLEKEEEKAKQRQERIARAQQHIAEKRLEQEQEAQKRVQKMLHQTAKLNKREQDKETLRRVRSEMAMKVHADVTKLLEMERMVRSDGIGFLSDKNRTKWRLKDLKVRRTEIFPPKKAKAAENAEK